METTWLTDFTGDTRQEVLRHLAAVPADRRFVTAERNTGFLRSVVEKTPDGRAHEIKEMVIAIEVYGRSERYDLKSDSIVRVEASRLRQKLRSYYENEGRDAGIRIHLASGSYAPRFERVATGAAPAPAKTAPLERRAITLAVAAGIAVLPVLIALPLARGSDFFAGAARRRSRHGATRSQFEQDPHTEQTEAGAPKTLLRAVERLEYAVARSPRFAPAWATLAEAYDYAAEFVLPDSAGSAPHAEPAARTAIRLDDSLAAGHHMLALQFKSVR